MIVFFGHYGLFEQDKKENPASKREDMDCYFVTSHKQNVVWQEVSTRNSGLGYQIGDYVYLRDKTSAKGVLYLRCQLKKQYMCKARAVIAGENGKNEVKIMGQHNHPPAI